jgi:hypothetical protein
MLGLGPDLCRRDVLGARFGQPTAHERLVLGPQRRSPVLAGHAEVLRRQRGLRLQVVGIGKDRVRGWQRRDRADQLASVPDIALQDPDRRGLIAVILSAVILSAVILIVRQAARAWPPPRARTGSLVLRWLVSEQDHVQAETGGRGKEAMNYGIGRLGRDQIKPHALLQLSLG